MPLPTLYLETTIVSYLAARPSRDVRVLAHQEITREWWRRRRHSFAIRISPVVREEIALGDRRLAGRRLRLVRNFPSLPAVARVEDLTAKYLERLRIPERALRDAAHLAFASFYGVDYLLTWNCAHIANAEVRRQLRDLNAELEMAVPTICTPEELLDRAGG